MQHVSLSQETHCHACKYFVSYIRVDTSLAQSQLHKHNNISVLIKGELKGSSTSTASNHRLQVAATEALVGTEPWCTIQLQITKMHVFQQPHTFLAAN